MARISDAERAATKGTGLSLEFLDEIDQWRRSAGLEFPIVELFREWPDDETREKFERLLDAYDDGEYRTAYKKMLRDATRSGGMPGAGGVRFRWPSGELGGGVLWIQDKELKQQPPHIYTELRNDLLRCLGSWSRWLSRKRYDVLADESVRKHSPEVDLIRERKLVAPAAAPKAAPVEPSLSQLPEPAKLDPWGALLHEFQHAYEVHGGETIWLDIVEFPPDEDGVTIESGPLIEALGLHGNCIEHGGGGFDFQQFGCKAMFVFHYNGTPAEQEALVAFKRLAKRAGALVAVDHVFEPPPPVSPQELWSAAIHSSLRDTPTARRWKSHVFYNPLHASIEAIKQLQTPAKAARAPLPVVAPKRSTAKNEARLKIVAALLKHHEYDDGSCLNLEPIGNNALARLADVGRGTVSDFISDKFGSRDLYRAKCRDAGSLAISLKMLNNDLSPVDLYGRTPPGEFQRDDDE